MENLESKTYYKYRSFEEFERFLDIIVNNRLYGAVYKALNDPMEGKYNKEGLVKDDYENINHHLKRTRICSLLAKQEHQRFPDDYLMWSHYANSHTGCCIELNITKRYNKGWYLSKVKYQKELPKVDGDIKNKINGILSVKTPIWENEHEVRAIRIYEENKFNTNSPYYHIKIKAIYLGCKITKDKCDFYKKIISSINPNIDIYWIREKKDNNDFFPTLIANKL